jgi:ABC-type Fe3+-hydroxamate transport system substrate-binding protein
MDASARPGYIMAPSMRRFAPLLLGLLAACGQVRPVDPTDTTIANATGQKATDTAKMVQNANAAGQPTTAPAAAPTTPAPGSSAAAAASTPGAVAPVAVDTRQKREYADVYVDLKDPTGQKSLASYLLKPEEWNIEKVTQVSPTVKHWRFWRVVRTDGKALPEVDPLRPKPAETSTRRPKG